MLVYCQSQSVYRMFSFSLQCKAGLFNSDFALGNKDIHSLVIQPGVKWSLTAIDKVTWRVCIVNIMTLFNAKNDILFSYLSIMFIQTRTMSNNNDILWLLFCFQEILPKLHIFIQPYPPCLQNFIIKMWSTFKPIIFLPSGWNGIEDLFRCKK